VASVIVIPAAPRIGALDEIGLTPSSRPKNESSLRE